MKSESGFQRRVYLAASLSLSQLLFLGCSQVDVPPAPSAPFEATTVAVGSSFACGLTNQGAVFCWGAGGLGQLGNGTKPRDSTTPVAVQGLEAGVVQIAAGGSQACAVTDAGAVMCWGELTSSPPGWLDVATPIEGLGTGVASVSVGFAHLCALMTSGSVLCMTGSDPIEPPVAVPGLPSNVKAISVGGGHACALTDAGGVFCWGGNDEGELGNPAKSDGVTALPVVGLESGVTSISAGQFQTCALTDAGAVACWGAITSIALESFRVTPETIAGLEGPIKAVSVGNEQTCAVTSTGSAVCWGYDYFGELGNGIRSETFTAPGPVHGLSSEVAQIVAGDASTCATTTQGKVLCWGRNAFGQVGDGTEVDRYEATHVSAP